MTEPAASNATEAIVDAVRSIDELRAAASLSAPAVATLFSWQRIAKLHVERYEEAC